jgi:hypothetical protein
MPSDITITVISILRAGILQPHGSESGTWHNRELIRRHECADASPCLNTRLQQAISVLLSSVHPHVPHGLRGQGSTPELVLVLHVQPHNPVNTIVHQAE